MKYIKDTAHEAVLKEWWYWYDRLTNVSNDNGFIFADNSEGRHTRAITASNLTIASLKFMEE